METWPVPVSLVLLLVLLLILAAFSAFDLEQNRQVTPAPWLHPAVVIPSPSPSLTPGWWGSLPSPAPLSEPTPEGK